MHNYGLSVAEGAGVQFLKVSYDSLQLREFYDAFYGGLLES